MFPKDDLTKMIIKQAVDQLNNTSATVEKLSIYAVPLFDLNLQLIKFLNFVVIVRDI